MAMRETTGSLKAYFIVVGVLSAARDVVVLTAGELDMVTKIALAIGLLLSVGYLIVGIFMRPLLVQAPAVILVLICVNLAIAAGIGLLVYSVTRDTTNLVVMGFVLLISIYLLVNVNRLSREERALAFRSEDDDLVDAEGDEEENDDEVRRPTRRPRR